MSHFWSAPSNSLTGGLHVSFCRSARYPPRLTIPTDNILRLLWSRIDKKFQTIKSGISKHVKDFEDKRQGSVDEELVGNTRKTLRVLETLPAVTILPVSPSKLFEVPFIQNPRFTGRETELAFVRHELAVSPTAGNPRQGSCLLHGLGGVGKTAVAAEYAFRFRADYDYVFWIPSQGVLNLSIAAVNISRKLGLSPADKSESHAQLGVERLRSWLEMTGKRNRPTALP